MSFVSILLLLSTALACALRVTPAVGGTRQRPIGIARACTRLQADEPEPPRGFGAQREEDVAAAARGREALDQLRAASSERGYDPTLQGLRDSDMMQEELPPAEVPQEFKSTVTLGFAGCARA